MIFVVDSGCALEWKPPFVFVALVTVVFVFVFVFVCVSDFVSFFVCYCFPVVVVVVVVFGLSCVLVFSTDINPHDVTVRNLDFTYLPQTGKFDLNVTWLQPSFNYSQMSSYSLSYQVNGGKKITTSTVGVKILLSIF